MNDPNDPDPKQRMSADSLIGLICEDYKIRLMQVNNRNGTNGNIKSLFSSRHMGACVIKCSGEAGGLFSADRSEFHQSSC
jgi:hypothetical protein